MLVYETSNLNSDPPTSHGIVRDVDLGQEGSTPEQIVQLLTAQFPNMRMFAYNSQDPELPGWEEITVANATSLPALLADRMQLKAVQGTKAPHQTAVVRVQLCVIL